MSAGVFQTVLYSSNVTGTIHPIRVQPETLSLSLGGTANAAATGTAILPSAQVSKGKRSIGINARTVTVKFATGNEPDGYKPNSPITVPWLQNNAAFINAVPNVTVVTYLSETAILVGKSPEFVR
jgi:hypothetical protein